MSNYFHGFMRFQILRITLVHLILLIILTSCDKIPGEEEGLENEPKKYGVVLTVDDGYIDQWYEYLDYMSEMNVLLTFYLTRYHTYSNETKRKVKELISRGHEMAFHGTNHYCYSNFIKDHSIEEYLQQEILDGLKYLESDTIFARHFAYPCGSNSPESDTLVKNHFTSVRKIAWTENSNRVDTLNSFFYSVPCNQPIIRGMGIDQGYNISLEQICRSLDRSRRDELALLLFCHKIDDSQGVYVLSPELFKSVVEYCHNNDIPFLTLSQMYAHE